MKKLTLTAALLAALTLTACGNKTTEATPTPHPEPGRTCHHPGGRHGV